MTTLQAARPAGWRSDPGASSQGRSAPQRVASASARERGRPWPWRTRRLIPFAFDRQLSTGRRGLPCHAPTVRKISRMNANQNHGKRRGPPGMCAAGIPHAGGIGAPDRPRRHSRASTSPAAPSADRTARRGRVVTREAPRQRPSTDFTDDTDSIRAAPSFAWPRRNSRRIARRTGPGAQAANYSVKSVKSVDGRSSGTTSLPRGGGRWCG